MHFAQTGSDLLLKHFTGITSDSPGRVLGSSLARWDYSVELIEHSLGVSCAPRNLQVIWELLGSLGCSLDHLGRPLQLFSKRGHKSPKADARTPKAADRLPKGSPREAKKRSQAPRGRPSDSSGSPRGRIFNFLVQRATKKSRFSKTPRRRIT